MLKGEADDGLAVGLAVGVRKLGDVVPRVVGLIDGALVGAEVGLIDGAMVGVIDRAMVGAEVGAGGFRMVKTTSRLPKKAVPLVSYCALHTIATT